MSDRLSQEDIIWLAGYLEGEAWFGCSKNTPRIAVATTDLDVAIRVANMWDRKWVLKHTKVSGRKQAFVTTIGGTPAIMFMIRVYPFMGERRQKKILECISTWSKVSSHLGNPNTGPKANNKAWVAPHIVEKVANE